MILDTRHSSYKPMFPFKKVGFLDFIIYDKIENALEG